MTDAGGDPHPAGPIAKLRREGCTAYALCGVGTLACDTPGFVYDLFEFVREAIQEGGPLRAVGQRLVANTQARIDTTLRGEVEANRGDSIHSVLGRFEGGRPVL